MRVVRVVYVLRASGKRREAADNILHVDDFRGKRQGRGRHSVQLVEQEPLQVGGELRVD